MREYPNKIKKLIREFAAEAHERELHRELAKLDRRFTEWRDGKLGSGGNSLALFTQNEQHEDIARP